MTVSGASGPMTVCVDLGVVFCLGAFVSVLLGRDVLVQEDEPVRPERVKGCYRYYSTQELVWEV